MSKQILEADYLIIGAGASGMAFADILIAETKASIILIDKHDRPGGHWNDAYPFVRLDHPSLYYGVNSRRLGNNLIDEVGFNKGYNETASAPELLAYYDNVLNHQFLPTGRVQYFPLCEYLGRNVFRSKIMGDEYKVKVNKKVVDATYLNVEVPLTHKKRYETEEGVVGIPPNALPNLDHPHSDYVIVGSGKTAVDTCIWLLQKGVSPAGIQWVMPRDAWMINRDNLQPNNTIKFVSELLEAAIKSESVNDYLKKLSDLSYILRIDEDVVPSTFRGAVISPSEIELIRQVKQIIRLGHIKKVEKNKIVLENGSVLSNPNKIYIDCTGNGAPRQPTLPVFNRDTITLQPVAVLQIPFSACLIAHVESSYQDEINKNEICTAVPIPNTDIDYIKMWHGHFKNVQRWQKDKELWRWISKSKIEFMSVAISRLKFTDVKEIMLLLTLNSKIKKAIPKLNQLLKDVD